MHLPHQITDLAIILMVAAVVTYICQKIRQPLVLGYLLAGVIVGPHTPTGLHVTDLENVKIWAELGVIFLMFSLGLEFTFLKLLSVGPAAVGTSVVEVVLMVGVGYGVGQWLGWNSTDSLFLGAILAISSTTIIIKAFDELKLKTRRFAEVVMGVLIVEDLFAILLMVMLSTLAAAQAILWGDIVFAAFKLSFIVGSWFVLGYFLIPSFFKYAGRHLSAETLTVMASALCLLLVVVATHYGYSAALGAFMMGSILGQSSESARIEKLIEPVRDLFAAVFFVSVGMLVDPSALREHWVPILIITVVTIIGKLGSAALGAFMMGQSLRRSVRIGFSLAQIGEFSFIIATLGASLRVTSDFLFPIAVTVSVVTTFTTPYLIRFSEPFVDWLEKKLPTSWNHRLASYSAWMSTPRVRDSGKNLFWRECARFGLNALVVTLVFVAVIQWGSEVLGTKIAASQWFNLTSWCLAILLAAPFVWGMLSSFHREKFPAKNSRVWVFGFFSRLATVIWLGILSSAFFSTTVSFVVTAVAALFLFRVLYQRLERSYLWFERRFVQNVKGESGPAEERRAMESLAPWDLHMVRMRVHQNSAFLGQPLASLDLRSRFGLNVVLIQRGHKVIASPGAQDVLFPHDEILVVGTDEQIESFRSAAETPSGDTGDGKSLGDYSLKQFVVTPDFSFLGQPLRTAGLRDKLSGLVVGLERGKTRTINPDPNTPLQTGDVLYIIGNRT